MTEIDPKNEKLAIPWKFYLSRGLSSWGDRLWTFACGVFMTKLDESASLRLVGAYGLVLCLSIFVSGAALGNWIDRTGRLKAARVFLAVQNASTAVCCAGLALYFWREEDLLTRWQHWNTVVALGVILVADIAHIASQGTKIVVVRDWIVVIAGGDKDRLAAINSVFVTIDLVCSLLAPLLAGFLFEYIGDIFTAVFLGSWNVVSVVFEYNLLAGIYHQYPELAQKQIAKSDEKLELKLRLKDTAASWKLYFGHHVRNAGLALACVYLTVLGFDNVTFGFCLHQCVPEVILGAIMGVSALSGILGSVLFPYLRRKVTLHRLGLWSFALLMVTLSPCVISIWLPGSPFQFYAGRNDTAYEQLEGVSYDDECYADSYVSVAVFLAGITAARFALWMADLSVIQILQQSVAEKERGALGGVQSAMNSAADSIKFALVIALPDDDTFGWLIMISYAFYALATAFYVAFLTKVRNLGLGDGLISKDEEEEER